MPVVLQLDAIHLGDRRVVFDKENVTSASPAGVIVAREADPARELEAGGSEFSIREPKCNTRLDAGRQNGRAGHSSLSHLYPIIRLGITHPRRRIRLAPRPKLAYSVGARGVPERRCEGDPKG